METRNEKEGVEREEKSRVGKFKRGILVAKRGGFSTPSPRWRFEFSSHDKNNNPSQEFLNFPSSATVSARKLCATLWEIESPHPQQLLPFPKMSATTRRRRHYQSKFSDPPNSPPPQRTTDDRKNKLSTAAAIQDPCSSERNGYVPQPVFHDSDSSSLEVAPCRPADTPTSPLDFQNKLVKSCHNLNTSTDLLKVLNRIWTLEEQHESTESVVKGLKKELYHSQARIKELLLEKQSSKQKTDSLLKIKDRIKASVQSLRDELEGERKLRNHSESLHRKLSRDLSEVKSTFCNAVRELERERKARILLESLCDEFAKGIRDYEQEVRCLKHKTEKDLVGGKTPDRLVVHISEAWLDERMQMKLEEDKSNATEQNYSIVDKLIVDIETFLQARRSMELKMHGTKGLKENCSCRNSLESIPLNDATSPPQNAADEEEFTDTDSPCLKLSKSNGAKKERCEVEESQTHNETSEIREANPEEESERQSKQISSWGLNSNRVADNFIRNSLSSSLKGEKTHSKGIFDFEKSDSSSKWPLGIKENTLMAKLLEARLEGRLSRSKTTGSI